MDDFRSGCHILKNGSAGGPNSSMVADLMRGFGGNHVADVCAYGR